MKSTLLWVVVLAGAAMVALAGFAYASSRHPQLTRPVTVHVIEHATTDTQVNIGTGDSTGDPLTWHNKIYNAANNRVVGHDQGVCVRIDPSAGSWECYWTTFLHGGQVTVEGPFYDTHDSTLAITGGTGKYRNARGQMLLKSRNGGAEYDFIFQLQP